ncbi:MAG: ATP-binding protein [Nanoarchaeota archaeon]|nr:ATP-binding protein [DPANN group archaeon]MBL7116999.1 ATP-binding protein [Nanoarchaeota archaeon]
MIEVICLEEELLEDNARHIRRELARPYYNLFSALKSKDSRKDVNSREISIVCDSIERLFSTQKSVYETLLKSNHFKDNGSLEAKDFLQIYSCLLSAEKALNNLKNERASNRVFDKSIKIDFETGHNTLIKSLVDTYKENLSRTCDDELDVVAITKGFFEWIKDNCLQYYKSEKYSDYAALTNNLHIKVDGVSISGNGKLNGQIGDVVISSDARKDQVVGNKELIRQIETGLKLLFLYDLKNKIHPHILRYGSYVQRILAIGRPGCGKSFTLEAMVNEVRQLSELYRKPIHTKDISNDLKSKYYSESSHNIKRVFQEVDKGESLYIIIADDLDTVIFGRKENEESENISVFGEFIRNLESIKSQNKGNYLLLATTNKPENMDPALLRRFQKKIIVKGPESIDDYISLLRIKLAGYVDDELVQISEWEKVGAVLYENKVPGSLVADIASSLSDRISDVDLPNNIYKLDCYKTAEMFPHIYNSITEREVLDEINLKINEYRCLA